jgi:hypothetical protein
MRQETNGTWRAIAMWLFAFLQAITLYVVADIRAIAKEQGQLISKHAEALAVIEARHTKEDRKP